jgi:hypothetical protein
MIRVPLYKSEQSPTNRSPTIDGFRCQFRHRRQNSHVRSSRHGAPLRLVEMKRLAVLGNHLPRRCGIATFTTHLAESVSRELPDVDCFVLAMNDAGRRHAYPSRVRFEIAEGDLGSYQRAADFLNVNQVDVLSVQHEYGIFGGKAGAHVLVLLR